MSSSQFNRIWSLFHELDFKLLTTLNYLTDRHTVMHVSMRQFIPISQEMLRCEVELAKSCLGLVSIERIQRDPDHFLIYTFMAGEMLRDLRITFNKYKEFLQRYENHFEI